MSVKTDTVVAREVAGSVTGGLGVDSVPAVAPDVCGGSVSMALESCAEESREWSLSSPEAKGRHIRTVASREQEMMVVGSTKRTSLTSSPCPTSVWESLKGRSLAMVMVGCWS